MRRAIRRRRCPPTVLKDPKVIAGGEALWKENCAHCHGSKAYPGKAPKLQPTKYKPEFVWDRVHNGFRDMPPWKELYSARAGHLARRLGDERGVLAVTVRAHDRERDHEPAARVAKRTFSARR